METRASLTAGPITDQGSHRRQAHGRMQIRQADIVAKARSALLHENVVIHCAQRKKPLSVGLRTALPEQICGGFDSIRPILASA